MFKHINLFCYLQKREINYPFNKNKPIITLNRKWTKEFAWYFDNLNSWYF